jgi:hypothetical protein
VVLSPENGISMEALKGRVEFYEKAEHKGKFKAFLRGSPRVFKRQADGDLILSLLRDAEKNPVSKPVDPKKLNRKPLFKAERKKGRQAVIFEVSVPEREEPTPAGKPQVVGAGEGEAGANLHTEIQHHLLQLGMDMGYDVWVARNDRGKRWDGKALGDSPKMVTELPTQFNEATNRTIELIDVLWLKGNSIVAAFEVECTTAIYSGLLRMSDLLALQPNLNIKLYLVAPDERQAKVEQEILRPTFSLRDKPLSEVCGFISIPKLVEKLQAIQKLGLAGALKPEFLEQTAEYFGKKPGD